MIRRVALVLVLSTFACGDNAHVEDLFEPVSGSRLKLEWFLYEDGTRQPSPGAFYDTQLHTRCAAQRWIDDVVRCVPLADEAVYIDATCTNVIGRSHAIDPVVMPTHFIGHDRVAGALLPARLYRAGLAADAISEFYEMVDGVCSGPFFEADAVTYFELIDEIRGVDVMPIRDLELGEGRLALHLHESDDGLHAPIELLDRELGMACTPMQRPDGVICEPVEASPATLFRDPACVDHVIAVSEPTMIPTIATVTAPSGCPSYHTVGAELPPSSYRRVGDRCVATTLPPQTRLFTVGARLDLPIVDRTIEDVAGRRLQRIILSTDDLRFVDDALQDTAIRAACRRYGFDDVTRCIPAAVAIGTTLFARGCVIEVRVTEIPQQTCERFAFATAQTEQGLTIHAIGDPVSEPLYRFDGADCEEYVPTPGAVVRRLGPPLPPETFVGAVVFGER